MRLKQTVTKPAFLMPLTNPKFDVDVSASMVNGGAVEMGLSQVGFRCSCARLPSAVTFAVADNVLTVLIDDGGFACGRCGTFG